MTEVARRTTTSGLPGSVPREGPDTHVLADQPGDGIPVAGPLYVRWLRPLGLQHCRAQLTSKGTDA